MDIMTSLFDQEEVLRRHIISTNREREKKAREEGREEGREKGREEGREEGNKNATLKFARKTLQTGRDSIEYVADFTGLTIDEVERIAQDVRNND